MAGKRRATVVGVFADHQQAGQAVAELRQAGFRDDQITVTPSSRAGRAAGQGQTDAAQGAAPFRALVGFLKGLLDPAEEVYDYARNCWVPQTVVRVQGGRRSTEALGILQGSGGFIDRVPGGTGPGPITW